jgi:adenosylcobinamide kinase/adenosylcobinamide-phosphate guanylyltransferase
MADPLIPHAVSSELILGGQKSGKSRRAEQLARQWLDADPGHCVVFIVTARAGDEEMRQRIARHQADRAVRLPGAITVEEPLQLALALAQHSAANTLVVVDCLTLWLTNCLMPVPTLASQDAESNPVPALVEYAAPATDLLAAQGAMCDAMRDAVHDAVQDAKGPVVLVSNEIGMGVIPLGAQVRAFLDQLGLLHQKLAAACDRVTLMVAGLPLTVKGSA